jgi:hypothetical protein
MIKSRRMSQMRNVSRMEKLRNLYNIFLENFEGKRPLWKSRLRWEANIKMELNKIGYDVIDWILRSYDRVQWWAVANTAMYLRVPYKTNNLTGSAATSFSRTFLYGAS